MQPFVVDFEFASPICRESEYPIHLDGLIAYAVMRELEEMGEEDPWKGSEDLSGYLARTEGENWCWKASWIKYEPLTSVLFTNTVKRAEPDLIYQSFEAGLWGSKRAQSKTINTQSGQYRAYQWLLPYQWVRGKAWGVGHIEDVEYLLQSRITYIGKQTRNGYGRIKSIKVSPAKESEVSFWMYRVLPEVPKEQTPFEYAEVFETIRPPYWKKIKRVRAFEPVV